MHKWSHMEKVKGRLLAEKKQIEEGEEKLRDELSRKRKVSNLLRGGGSISRSRGSRAGFPRTTKKKVLMR